MTRALLVLAATLLAGAASARECRAPADLPPGVRVPPAPGCEQGSDRMKQAPSKRPGTGRDAGFVDLGNGSQLRVSGRVRVDVGGRR